LGLATTPAHANQAQSRTNQFNTSSVENKAVAISLKFNSTSRAYSAIATTTINHLGLNTSGDVAAAQLRFYHEFLRPVGKNEEGFMGPTHTVLPASANTSLPRTFVDSFGPCQLVNMFGLPLDARATFIANQVIQVNTTVRVELIDVVSVVVDAAKGVLVPSARTQYFATDLPHDVSELIVVINSSDHHTNVSSVFASVTIGCGHDAQVVVLDHKTANDSSAVVVVPVKKGGRTFMALQMVEGVPLPKKPSFLLSFETKGSKHDDDDFWQPWVIGVIVGGGIGLAGFVLVVIGVVVWTVRSKRHYHRIN
jgi:hypothetical protein